MSLCLLMIDGQEKASDEEAGQLVKHLAQPLLMRLLTIFIVVDVNHAAISTSARRVPLLY